MKKTLPLLLVVTLLGIATLFVGDEQPPEAPALLRIAGYATTAELDARKGQSVLTPGAEIAYPVDGLTIRHGENTITLTRAPDSTPASWRITTPIQATAVKYQVEKMIRLFESPTAAVYAKRISPEDLPLFDLEAGRRIDVTLQREGTTWNEVALRIGKVTSSELRTAEGGVVQDTWVQRIDQPNVVYRVGGKDLRSPFEGGLNSLRDKRLFSIKAEQLETLSITGPDGRVVSVARQADDDPVPGAPNGNPSGWQVTAPKNGPADRSAQGLASSLTSIRAQRFVMLEGGPAGGLGEAPWRLVATPATGAPLELAVEAGDGEERWARVSGQDEWVVLDGRAADRLLMTYEDLRDKTLLPVSPGAINRISFSPPDARRVTARRSGERWTFRDGAAADVTAQLKSVISAKAQRYARPGEKAAAHAALSAPDFSASVGTDQGNYLLSFGPAEDVEGGPVARWVQLTYPDGTRGDPVRVQEGTTSRFRKTRDELTWKRAFNLEGATIDRMDVTWPDAKTAFTLERKGEGLVPSPLPQGKRPVPMAIGSMENTFSGLRAKAFQQKSPQAVGLAPNDAYRFTAHLSDGRALELRISRQTEGDDPFATTSTGPLSGRVFTISQFQALNLQKTVDELLE